MGSGGDDKNKNKSPAKTPSPSSALKTGQNQDRPGQQYGSESYIPEHQKLDPQIVRGKPFQDAKKSFGPAAHEVQWGPSVFSSYTDTNNPFYYRTPKNIDDVPAHVPQNPINIELHLRDERQRMTGMTKAERDWRRKYVTDQNLHPDEPFFIEEAQNHMNPLRRLYRWPWDTLARKFLYPKFGIKTGHSIRQKVPKYMLAFIAVELCYYHIKYNQSTWDDSFKSSTLTPHPVFGKGDELEALHPGLIEKAYPQFKTASDFADLGFKNRTIFLDVGETKRPW